MTTRSEFSTDVLKALGIVPSEPAITFLVAVDSFEDSNAAFNPQDTTLDEPGATKFNSVGVRNFPTLAEGVEATVATLKEARYGKVVDLMRGQDANAMATALAEGGWAGTDQATVINYSNDLHNMIATVQADPSKYFDVVVAGSTDDDNSPSLPSTPAPSPAPTPTHNDPPKTQIDKVQSATNAQEAELKRDEAAHIPKSKIQALVAKLETHLSEWKDLLK